MNHLKSLNLFENNVSKEIYIIRDWLVSELHQFEFYDDAKKKYDELLLDSEVGSENENECDIQFYKILDEYNNIDNKNN